ncbi:MAG: hypothetical protein ABR874_14670, partial [Candidatus Sulfotelmatobacter sp.]
MKTKFFILIVGLCLCLTACSNSNSNSSPNLTLGGKVSGLAGSGLVLQNNHMGYLAVPANGPFTFVNTLSSGE